MNLPTVSIIFTNWNGGHQPLELLRSIKHQNYPKTKIEVIMVDNNSTDGSTEQVSKKFKNVKIIRFKRNLGFSKAINIGIKKSKSEYNFVTNDDLAFEKNSLLSLINYLIKHPEIGVISGKIFFKPPKKGLTNSAWRLNYFTGLQYPIKSTAKITQVDWVSAALLFKKSLINKVGGFDEGFSPAYFEDVDFCRRVKNHNLNVIYYPKAIFYHFQGASISKIPYQTYLYYGFRNKIRFFLKHANPIQIMTFLFSQFLVIMPLRKLISEYKSPMPEIKALVYNLRVLSQIIKNRCQKENN